ncbi:MAG: Nif3-like dinuclear metal center hexameric protein [Oscillospiraceae bacterium]|nr:Nif3-like dinuclear metal center hexameric protein [Oscillospiraceae bacterium]
MTTIQNILDFIETLAPRELKMDWDNVGLLCGSRNAPVDKILVALDPFEHVCKEAAQLGAQLVLTHHPLIFTAPKTVTDDTSIGRSIQLLCRHGISAINAHTNLDCAPGGVNDVLASALGLQNVETIGSENLLRAGFVEETSLDDFLGHVKASLGAPALRYVSGNKPVRKVAVGGGSCASSMTDALAAGCDTFVTSDIRYNQFWDAQDLHLNLIDAGHFYTENPVIPVLAEKLQAAFPEIQVIVSKKHADCMKFY